MRTERRKTIRSLVATLAVSALAVTGLGTTAWADDPDVLDASQMEARVYSSDTSVGRFVVRATESHPVEVDRQNRTGGGMSFTQRLKLNGGGTPDRRSIHFTTHGEATVTAYALSASAGADRELALYSADGTQVDTIPAYGEPTDIPVGTLTVPEAGSWYVASPSSGVNVFHLRLTEGPAPERPAWDTVAAPVVTDVSVAGGDLVVSYAGVVGFDGADLATATLYADGTQVTSAISGSPGDAGTVRLTPSASGDYEVQVALSRTGEDTALLSERVAAPSFTLPLATPTIHSALTSAVADGVATVTVEWTAVPEAETYAVSYREAGASEWVDGPTTASARAEVVGLTPESTYEVRVTAQRGEDATTSATFEVTVAAAVERWLTAQAGVSSGGTLTEREDGSLHFDMRGNNGKIADSEDGFLYHYTQIDPGTENFTLSATFTVVDSSGKDNQSGFGLIAVDTFVPGDRAARYFNSAGTMTAKYQRVVDGGLQFRYGIPGGKIVTGYTEGPTVPSADRDLNQSQPFDWDYRPDMVEGSNLNPPKFRDGDVYEYTLRRSNTGYHSTWVRDGEEQEVIHYERDLLEQQDPDALYVGVFAARNIVVTASDISFTTIHPDDDEEPLERPISYVAPSLVSDVTRTTPHSSIEVPLVANVRGEVVLRDGDGTVVGTASVTPGERVHLTAPLADGSNPLVAELTPAPRGEQTQLGEYEDLTSYEPLTLPVTITVQRFGTPGQAIHVAPDGTADGDGTPERPLDLHTGVAFAQPGQQVVLAHGTYLPTRAVVIARGNSGTAEAPLTLMSAPGGRATIDLSESTNGGIQLRGDHWHLHDLEITRSRGYQKPLLIQGHHNVVERIESHHNGDTGVQISGNATEPFEMWPSHNLVLSSVAHNNADPLANDADGFAAKLTVGDGNVFRYCIAFHNIDDGWDLYAKSTEGPIGAVVVEDSVTFRNGWLEADEEMAVIGEGNGFKLGGENMPGAHVLRNSVAFDNYAKGITSNSGPDVRIHDVTAYRSGLVAAGAAGNNLQLTTSAATTDYRATGVLSYVAQQPDQIGLRGQEDTIRTDPSNYLTFTGGGARDASRNSEGVHVQDDWFVSLDTGLRPEIAEDGSIEMHGLLEPTDQAPSDTGARLTANPEPTQITLLPPVTGATDPTDPGPTDPGPTDPGPTDPGPTDPGPTDPVPGPSFSDVRPGHPFYAEIRWLADAGIAAGYSDGTFRPSTRLSRQAMAAFIHRYAGDPGWAPEPGVQTFPDVPASHPFHTEIEWLAAHGLAEGYADGTFRPSTRMSRQAMAAFMFRLSGDEESDPAGRPAFADVDRGHPFFTEIQWMFETGLSSGYEDGTYLGSRGISRQAMAAFLARYDSAFGG